MTIQKIRNILRQFGEWATGWNSFRKNLQSRFLLSFIISLAAGSLFFSLTFFISWNIYEVSTGQEYLKSLNKLKDIGSKLAGDLNGSSIYNSTDYLEEVESQTEYSFIMINYEGVILYNKGLPADDSFQADRGHLLDDGLNYQIPITFKEESILIIIQLNNDKQENMMIIMAIPIILVSVIVFFTFFYFLSRRIIVEIHQIAVIVEKIKKGNRSVRINLKGEDELSQLGDNINEMATAITDTIKEIKKSELYKRELITGMSHDLKTPLTSLIGYLMLLKDDDKRKVSRDDRKQYIELSYRKSIQLKKLTEDLFEYSKYSSRSVKLDPVSFSMKTFIEQIIESYIPQMETKSIPFESTLPEKDIRFKGDPQLLSRAMGNLMDNMLKYSEGDRKSGLHLKKEDNEIRIKLNNRVISLETEDLSLLFERMTRGDSSRTALEGSGLGLAICREIIHLHQGKISACRKDDMFEIEMVLPLEN